MIPLEDSVDRHEGTSPKPYKDSRDLWTIGTGRCLETNPLTGKEWKALLDQGLILVTLLNDGSRLLRDQDLAQCAAECANRMRFWPQVGQVRRDVLTEMCFQMGIDKLLGFHQMLGHIDAGEFGLAKIAGLDSDWARYQSPARANELMDRLEAGT